MEAVLVRLRKVSALDFARVDTMQFIAKARLTVAPSSKIQNYHNWILRFTLMKTKNKQGKAAVKIIK